MIEQNYLEYPTTIKEAMGLKVDWKEKINNDVSNDKENDEPLVNKEDGHTNDINQVDEASTKSDK